MSLLVGLTGNMGSGKTMAAGLMKGLGAHILDADAVCRDLMRPGQPAWKAIVEHFGENILLEDQTLDRPKLASIVFKDFKQKEILEGILHPRVFQVEQEEYENLKKSNSDILMVVDAALLIESGNHKKMDKVVVITCNDAVRIQRLLQRGLFTKSEIERRLQSQMSQEQKVRFADFVLKNDGSKEELKSQVKAVFKKLQLLARTG
ncbi:MAG: dephospho-CoA kinase [Nitrospinales bacterium]